MYWRLFYNRLNVVITSKQGNLTIFWKSTNNVEECADPKIHKSFSSENLVKDSEIRNDNVIFIFRGTIFLAFFFLAKNFPRNINDVRNATILNLASVYSMGGEYEKSKQLLKQVWLHKNTFQQGIWSQRNP